MGRDTRPEHRTRYLDVPTDPLDGKRDEFFAGQLELIAADQETKGRGLGAALMKAASIAHSDEPPTDGSAIIRIAHAWFVAEREIPRDDEWAAELVRSAAAVAAFRSIPTSDFLLGVSAGLRGDTIAPTDASPTYRMGLRAVLDCERGRAGMTQLIVAADTEPDRGSDLDGEPTQPHACAYPVPPPLLTDPPRRPPPPQPPRPRAKPIASPSAPAIQKEEDAPEPRGRGRRPVVTDDDLTRAHLITKTEQLPQSRRK